VGEDVDVDESVGDAGGLDTGAGELEGVLEELGLGGDAVSRISMLPSAKI